MLTIMNEVEAGSTNYAEAPDVDVEVTITDDEVLPELRLTLTPSEAAEGTAAVDSTVRNTVGVTLRAEFVGPARSEATTLTLSIGGTGDTAELDVDYSVSDAPTPTILRIDEGRNTGEITFNLELVQDLLDEGVSETLSVTANQIVEVGEQVVFTTPVSLVFTILDDDMAGVDVTDLSGKTVSERTLQAGDPPQL